ncbi:hypothetical protein PILCRDRAFT_149848 [Piloderma croceum F 1598]|uniref:Uncharacterized protein n=1 Tax=Piloderma croceum (strain F 1598) TaxID=765440 RepID=A0A0C3G3F6_PILCF|nr:hypothetical protein PILCRDRAFT_149848 [Piloderma croceum F 1598]
MALFRGNTLRTVVGVVGAVAVGHLAMYLIPDSMHAFSLTQTALALLAISSLMVTIMIQHRNEDNLLSERQQEFLLIAAFGLAWFAVRVGLRAMNRRSGHPSMTGEINARDAMHPNRQRALGFAPALRPYPCSADDAYCVVEEWEFF